MKNFWNKALLKQSAEEKPSIISCPVLNLLQYTLVEHTYILSFASFVFPLPPF